MVVFRKNLSSVLKVFLAPVLHGVLLHSLFNRVDGLEGETAASALLRRKELGK